MGNSVQFSVLKVWWTASRRLFSITVSHFLGQCSLDGVHCGQLIVWKICKIGATRCQILRIKCTKFDFHWGEPQTPMGYVAVLPRRLALFKEPSSKEREGEGMGGLGRGLEGMIAASNWGLCIRQWRRGGKKDKERSLGQGV